MLWALLAYYFFGGFGGATALGHFYNDQAKSLIKAEVKDSRRRDNAQVFAEMVKKGVNTLLKETDQNGKKMKKLYQDYSSTPAQFDAVIQESLNEQRRTVSDIVQSRQALLRAVTQEEWNAIIVNAKRQDEAAAAKAAEKAAKKASKQAAPS
ncbi:MAG TPA: hypothetical protein VNY25_02615 [Steroidobacteraceae bacterium]|nr:hypothetical protein [Steroidobacteraceae bacterium]